METMISQVKLVGRIKSISEKATNHSYIIDDGTGTIEVRHWTNNESEHQV